MKRRMPLLRSFLLVIVAVCFSLAFTSCGKKKEQVQSKPPQAEQQQSEQPTEHPAADTEHAEHPTEHPTADSGGAEHPTEHSQPQNK